MFLKKINKLKKDTLLYKIYRYLKIKPHKSFAYFGEEILINKIFSETPNGFYVDVGAHHPKNGSLTFFLYKKGWHGINFDITEKNIDFLKSIRKRDHSYKVAISDANKQLNSYIFDEGSQLSSLEKDFAKKWSNILQIPYKKVSIQSKTLNKIFEDIQLTKIDYLNIDVEQHEYKVLKGIDLKVFRPKLITCEIHEKKIERILKSNSYKYLTKNKYIFISHYHITSFFVSEEFFKKCRFLNV